MEVYRHTLVCEGPTDANLIPILDWVLREKGGRRLVRGERADLSRLPKKPAGLAERIAAALEYYGGDLLFVHRDADREPVAHRHDEIRKAVDDARNDGFGHPAVAVVPVRMLEAWLLFDESAIRKASGNPHGRVKLELPSLHKLEDRPDPKGDLRQALETASEHRGRKLKKFSAARALWRITDYIDDFSPLRQLPAFAQLENAVHDLKAADWKPGFYA